MISVCQCLEKALSQIKSHSYPPVCCRTDVETSVTKCHMMALPSHKPLVPCSVTMDKVESCELEYKIPIVLHNYIRYDDRIKTFVDRWPKFLPGPSIEEMARAGFVYLGFSDLVKCFSCGIMLKEWGPEDCAWKEHMCHSEQCKFICLLEGFKVKPEKNKPLVSDREKLPESTGDYDCPW